MWTRGEVQVGGQIEERACKTDVGSQITAVGSGRKIARAGLNAFAHIVRGFINWECDRGGPRRHRCVPPRADNNHKSSRFTQSGGQSDRTALAGRVIAPCVLCRSSSSSSSSARAVRNNPPGPAPVGAGGTSGASRISRWRGFVAWKCENGT